MEEIRKIIFQIKLRLISYGYALIGHKINWKGEDSSLIDIKLV